MTDQAKAERVAPVQAARLAGRRADLSGRAAEARIAEDYRRRGYTLLAERWRGAGGEIDLVFGLGDLVVFTEVKKARSIEAAIRALRPAQMRRIHAAASEFLALMPAGQLSDVRFDLAAIGGSGEFQIIDDAFGHF